MLFSGRAWVFLSIILAAGGTAVYLLYDDVKDISLEFGQSTCETAQLEANLQASRNVIEGLVHLRQEEAAARVRADEKIQQLRNQWEADRARWRALLNQSPEARGFLRTDIPGPVDRWMCETLGCPDRDEVPDGAGGHESPDGASNVDAGPAGPPVLPVD